MKIKVEVSEDYRKLAFDFNSLTDAEAFISICVHQGYEVKIALPKEEAKEA